MLSGRNLLNSGNVNQGSGSATDPNNKGYFADPTALTTAYPEGEAGWFALVGSTDTIWVWDTDTTAWVNTGNTATGDVVGPASATNNAIPRFDTTTGKLIQDSVVLIDDAGTVTGSNINEAILFPAAGTIPLGPRTTFDTAANPLVFGGASLNVLDGGGITLGNSGNYGTVQIDGSGNYNFAMGLGAAMRFLNATGYEYDNNILALAGAEIQIFNAAGTNFSSLSNDADGNLNFTGAANSYIFDHRVVAPSIYNPVSGAAFMDVTNAKIYDQAASPIQFIDAANRLFYDPAGQNVMDLSAFLRIGIKGGSFLDFFNVANNHSFSITNNGASGGSISAMNGAASYRYDAPIWAPQLNTAAGTPMIILDSGGVLVNGYSAAVGHFDVYDPTDTDYASWSSIITGGLLVSNFTRATAWNFDAITSAPDLKTTNVTSAASLATDSAGKIIAGAARAFNNTPSHTIQTVAAAANGFQLSATRDAIVAYSCDIVTTASIGVNSSGTVVLEIAATNSITAGDWAEIARITNGQALSAAAVLTSTQTTAGCLSGVVPAGYYTRLRSINNSGTPSYAFDSGQEVLI